MTRRTRRRKARLWSHSEGERQGRDRPSTIVRVGEDTLGGVLYLLYPGPKHTLGHRDRGLAKRYAREQSEGLAAGHADLAAGRLTLGRVLALYTQYHTPTKSPKNQPEDHRRAELFSRIFGADRDVRTLGDTATWITYLDQRRSGAIDAHGKAVPDPRDRVPLQRDAALQAEVQFLFLVLNWASGYVVGDRPLLEASPLNRRRLKSALGRRWPHVQKENKRRPLADPERFRKVRGVAEQITALSTVNGKRGRTRTYLLEILDLCWHTGRRISQILHLQVGDFLPTHVNATTGKPFPHGALRWRRETDKTRRERIAPLNREARAAIDRIFRQRRPFNPEQYLFPHMAGAPGRPITKHTADGWLRRAERIAGLPHLEHGAWHPFRRTWATVRRHHAPHDVAHAGGWANPMTMQECYQTSDDGGMLTAVTEPAYGLEEAMG